MRRRELIGLIGATAAASFLRIPIAGAQKFGKPKLIAVVGGASAESARPQAEAIVQGLRDLGYAYGIDYEFAPHWANGNMRRLPALAKDAVRLNPDVIMAAPTQAAVAIKAITATIPIICFMLVDEVRLGLVTSDGGRTEMSLAL